MKDFFKKNLKDDLADAHDAISLWRGVSVDDYYCIEREPPKVSMS